ncbi:hypothetical protein L3Y34_002148 [Caenorhabditis briggsae]|uniref:Uncharacterized protein n=1 Tax=Caenorhabditis briggsae TaxID=6238 RepID=A0AAE9DDZ5_CAEBR|nr:hypothetical protein L3Y34_002148 [Caenorhabditis briggsae]
MIMRTPRLLLQQSRSSGNNDHGFVMKTTDDPETVIYGCKASSRGGYGAEDLKYLTKHIKEAHGIRTVFKRIDRIFLS